MSQGAGCAILFSSIQKKKEGDNMKHHGDTFSLANGVAIPLVESLPLYDLGLSWLIPAAVFGLAASLLRSHARKAEKVFSKPNEEL